MKFLARYADVLYALFRFVFGFLFFCHGTQKLLGWPGDKPTVPAGSLAWFGGIVELVGGAMIALGFFAGCAAFITSGTMAFAYFKFHAPGGPLPIVNKGELAALYCFAFLYIAAADSGRYALDAAFRRKSPVSS